MLYRQILAEQTDHGVVIASVGFLGNLARLLDSPADQFSDLIGRQLVERKVKELVITGCWCQTVLVARMVLCLVTMASWPRLRRTCLNR